MNILAVDVGTTSMKLAVYSEEMQLLHQVQKGYPINNYGGGKADIEAEKWWNTFLEVCKSIPEPREPIDLISFSGTTPGLTAMDQDGRALLPAILFMDGRSGKQSVTIRQRFGEQYLLDQTANLPVSGGCSLSSILWIKENHPDIFQKTAVFGHSNTFMVKRLTGQFAMDPTSASLSCLYNTFVNNMTWNADIAGEFGVLDKLPPLMPTYASPGGLTEQAANELGLKSGIPVLIGGNDAVLAAFSGDIIHPGEISNINGTCEITATCVDRCIPSPNYNIRTQVLPGLWLTFFVLNTGGKALEWFHSNFCPDMQPEDFYTVYLNRAIDSYLESGQQERYIPYLAGSRYSTELLTASFSKLNLETTRERLLGALVKGNCQYHKENLDEVAAHVQLNGAIHLTGGSATPALIRAKKIWMRDCDYVFQEQSSVKGAALLSRYYFATKV
jgi:xylulokinase